MAYRHPFASSELPVLRDIGELQALSHGTFPDGFNDDAFMADLDQAATWGFYANDNETSDALPSIGQRPAKKQRTGPSAQSEAISEAHVQNRGPDSDSSISQRTSRNLPPVIDLTEDLTEDNLLTEILEIFPDIDVNYLKGLIQRHLQLVLQTKAEIPLTVPDKDLAKGAVTEEILGNPSYPRKQRKLKRTLDEFDSAKKKEDDIQKWMKNIPQRGSTLYLEITARLLAIEFPAVPWTYIQNLTLHKRELYAAYLSLSALEDPSSKSAKPYKNEQYRHQHLREDLYKSYPRTLRIMQDLDRERRAAAAAARQARAQEAEERNVQTGNLVECQCCFEEVPANKILPCEGLDVHFFCYTCMQSSAKTQIGLMRYKLQCFDGSGCQAQFDRHGLRHALGKKIMDKLDALQQQDEIQQAGLQGLESCPFCDYHAICPPVEEDREFYCLNPDCEVISCRMCKEKSHVPSSCEDAKTDKRLPYRHRVEEALSDALMRTCPQCKVKIVKTDGCNMMTCAKCRTRMCYICNARIEPHENYEHFHRRGGCSLHDLPGVDPHRAQIERAEANAVATILAENPNIVEKEIRVNEGPKKQDAATLRQQGRPPQRPRQPQLRQQQQGQQRPPHRQPYQQGQPRQPTQGPQHFRYNDPFVSVRANGGGPLHVNVDNSLTYFANRIRDFHASNFPWETPGNTSYPLPNLPVDQRISIDAGFPPQARTPMTPNMATERPFPPYFPLYHGQAVPMVPYSLQQPIVNHTPLPRGLNPAHLSTHTPTDGS
ncbi:E3 ubiquitin-protein ligase RNF216 [Aspergillus saccharolyticus JOP 1030-1]|uniref:RING-type domain-containing protein n=1 Tax=Aspergillus saccharolyticus JOP 1030-1 TaxID=1450539 RepID=A0A318Z9F9_9EURO|nr:hypothetical protein BP01DRAFT_91580 [Aspergillus saccharolyticus JOP 1030-1]PYH43976.1 hypothetical protein BP01DRAFT_91580 [Aspergillus saccharolyticus JOP 1030-1]